MSIRLICCDMKLSLITAYRDRAKHMANQLAWWESYGYKQDLEWIVIEISACPSPDLSQQLQQHQVRYFHLPCDGPFHKTSALNLGLQHAQGQLLAAFDVDLIPVGDTLKRHCWLAERSPHFLVTGYRLMASAETIELTQLETVLAQASTGPEDRETALRKHLLHGERFGVLPLFRRDRLLAIGGWDETFVGWGAEDQDLIERYLTPEQALCRCPDLLYLHLHHEPAAGWNSAELTKQNRAHYYQSRQA